LKIEFSPQSNGDFARIKLKIEIMKNLVVDNAVIFIGTYEDCKMIADVYDENQISYEIK